MADDMTCTDDGHDPAAPLLTAALSHPRVGTVVCTAVGEVDLATGPLLLEPLQKATSDGPRHLIVDLSGVTFFSAVGVGVLMQTLAAQQDRYAMVLVGNSRPVMRVLAVLKLAQRFPRYDDVADAVAAVAGPPERHRCTPPVARASDAVPPPGRARRARSERPRSGGAGSEWPSKLQE
jgi:anti-sigma B factor antagonist